MANRSQKLRTEYEGAMKLNASAYPNFNFATNMTFLSVLGHVDAQIDFNNAVDLIDRNYTTSLRLMFARFSDDGNQFDGAKTSASIELLRPKSNIDLKLLIK